MVCGPVVASRCGDAVAAEDEATHLHCTPNGLVDSVDVGYTPNLGHLTCLRLFDVVGHCGPL